jgi:hypothetical protein
MVICNSQRQVQVSIKFLRIGEIDMMNEKYQAEILLESRWVETEKINEYDPKNWKHWNPKLFIENAFEDIKQQLNYGIAIENGKVIVTETRMVHGKEIFKYIEILKLFKEIFMNTFGIAYEIW